MGKKLDIALRLAARGFYLFPLQSNSKLPRTGISWPEISSRNPETLRDWFGDEDPVFNNDYNPAVDTGKSGFTVIDVDTKNNKPGMVNFNKIREIAELPETYIVHTPSGGLHFYFRAEGYRNSQGDNGGIAEGIDTRAEGGYVVAAGAVIDNKEYLEEDLSDGEMPELPSTWHDILKNYKAARREDNDAGKVIIEDHDDDIAWAVDYLTTDADPAVEGAGGDQQTFNTICVLKEHGVSKPKALELLWEHYNPLCMPPWDYEDLDKKVWSAYRSAHTATGAKSAHAEFDDIPSSKTLSEQQPISAAAPRPVLWLPKKFRLEDVPHRQWIYGDFVQRKQVNVIVSPGGVGKSTFTISNALAKASNKNIMGFRTYGRGGVALYNSEDSEEEMQRRIGAGMQHFNITQEDLWDEDVNGHQQRGFLSVTSGIEHPMQIAQRQGANNKLVPKDMQPIIEFLRDNKMDWLIVDPFAETHPGKENENEEMGIIGRMYRHVANEANVGVSIIHHTRKMESSSSEGHHGNLDSMRGASSLGGVARDVRTLYPMSEKQGKAYNISEERRQYYIMFAQAKANMSAPGANNHWFERYGVTINASDTDPDGEQVGILKPVKLSIRREQVTDATKSLLSEVEVFVEDGKRTIGDIAAAMIESVAFYHGKNKDSLYKAIRRCFLDNEVVTTPRGHLRCEELPTADGKGAARFISFAPKGGKNLDDYL